MNASDSPVVKRILAKLEALYPEHKVFALSSLDDDLRETLNNAYQSLGYSSMDDLLGDLGYERISASAVRDLRSEVLYFPGNEPEPIRSKIVNALGMLEEYYPDRTVQGSIQTAHKSLYMKLSGLSQWLGYADIGSLLEAYGYSLISGSSGRPENDYQALIDHLLEKYADKPKPKNMGLLIFDNPEYRSQLKTLQNKAPELFGMSLKEFLSDLGLFAEKEERSASPASAKSSGGSMQEAAFRALKEICDREGRDYGRAVAALEGLTVKQNKAGQIYVFRADRCPEILDIPYGIGAISSGAFKGQTGLREVRLPATVKEIASDTFSGCTSLCSVLTEDGLEAVGDRAFSGCMALESVVFPASVRTIGKEAFSGCSALRDVTIPDLTARVSPSAFDGCPYRYEPFADKDSSDPEDFFWEPGRKDTAIITGYRGTDRAVRIPPMVSGRIVTTIAGGAFQGNRELREVSIPDTVTSVLSNAFRDCEKLERVHLSERLSKIITTTFSGCKSLREINIPNDMSELKRSTFRDSPLQVLHIGQSLQTLSGDCFLYSYADPYTSEWHVKRTIEAVDVSPDNPWLRAVDGVLYSADGKKLITALKDFRSFTVPESVEEIGDSAFSQMTSLQDICFPAGLRIIGAGSFRSTGLRSIRLPSGVRMICEEAFAWCNDLASVLFEEGVEEIGDRAFDGCPIVSVLLPATVRRLGVLSFPCFGSFNDKMLDFRIEEGNPYLRADGTALYQLENGEKTLTVVYSRRFKEISWDGRITTVSYAVEDGTVRIADEAFSGCVNLTELTLPEGLKTIGKEAFKATGIDRLVIPSTVTEIGGGAFEGDRGFLGNRIGVRSVSLADGNRRFYTEDDDLYFCRDDGKNALVARFGRGDMAALPPQTAEIFPGAFACTDIRAVRLPLGLTEIGEGAFRGCSELRRLYMDCIDPSGKEKTAEIFLPSAEDSGLFWGTSLRDQFMDCIRSGHENGVFDFEKYDSLFESITENRDKVLVALDRLKTEYRLAPTYAANYRRFIQNNRGEAFRTVIAENDADAVMLLFAFGTPSRADLDLYIDMANRAGSTAVQVLLMNKKNSSFSFDFSDLDLSDFKF